MLPRINLTTKVIRSTYKLPSARCIPHATRRTMSSSSGKDEPQEQPAAAAAAAGTKPTEALPAPGEGTTSAHPVLDISSGGGTISLDAMGPIVVNKDGTIARLQNWGKMTDIEKENTLRILGKRNQQRLAALKEAEKAKGEDSTDGKSQ